MENLKKEQLMNKTQYCTNCNKKLNYVFNIDANELSHYTNTTLKYDNQDLINSEIDLHSHKTYDRYIIPMLQSYKGTTEPEKISWTTTKENRQMLKQWTKIYNSKPVYIKISTESTPFTNSSGNQSTFNKPILTPYSDMLFAQKIQEYKASKK